MENIRRVSLLVRVMLLFLAVVHVVVFGLSALQGEPLQHQSNQVYGEAESSQVVKFESPWPALEKSLLDRELNAALLLGAPQLVFYLLIYVALYRLFGFYQQGILFSVQSTAAFKRIGFFLLIWPVFNLLYPSLLTLTLFAMDVDVERSLTLSFGTDELKRLLAGLMVWVIGWVMAKGLSIHEENELVI